MRQGRQVAEVAVWKTMGGGGGYIVLLPHSSINYPQMLTFGNPRGFQESSKEAKRARVAQKRSRKKTWSLKQIGAITKIHALISYLNWRSSLTWYEAK